MILSDLLRAIVVLGFLFVRRADQLWIVYVLTVLQLALSTFFEPAKTAAIPSIVSDRELVAANAISAVTWSVMLTLGAAIGGIVTGWLGTNVAFVLDSFTYLLSAALITSVRLPRRPKRDKTKLTIGRALGVTETIEGARYVKHSYLAGSFWRTNFSCRQKCGYRHWSPLRGARHRNGGRSNRGKACSWRR
jgi:MFS family permease